MWKSNSTSSLEAANGLEWVSLKNDLNSSLFQFGELLIEASNLKGTVFPGQNAIPAVLDVFNGNGTLPNFLKVIDAVLKTKSHSVREIISNSPCAKLFGLSQKASNSNNTNLQGSKSLPVSFGSSKNADHYLTTMGTSPEYKMQVKAESALKAGKQYIIMSPFYVYLARALKTDDYDTIVQNPYSQPVVISALSKEMNRDGSALKWMRGNYTFPPQQRQLMALRDALFAKADFAFKVGYDKAGFREMLGKNESVMRCISEDLFDAGLITDIENNTQNKTTVIQLLDNKTLEEIDFYGWSLEHSGKVPDWNPFPDKTKWRNIYRTFSASAPQTSQQSTPKPMDVEYIDPDAKKSLQETLMELEDVNETCAATVCSFLTGNGYSVKNYHRLDKGDFVTMEIPPGKRFDILDKIQAFQKENM